MKPGDPVRLVLTGLGLMALFAVVVAHVGRRYMRDLDTRFHESLILHLPEGFHGVVEVREEEDGADIKSWKSKDDVIDMPVGDGGVVAVCDLSEVARRFWPGAVYPDGRTVPRATEERETATAHEQSVFMVEQVFDRQLDGGAVRAIDILIGDSSEYAQLERRIEAEVRASALRPPPIARGDAGRERP